MKSLMVLLLLLGIHLHAFSQLEPYQWRLGVSGGYTNYYGDLSPHPISSINDYKNFLRLFNYNENYVQDYSYALSLERRLSASVSLQLSTGKYSISMSDRYITPRNNLQLDAPNFNRALNFKTDILDWGLGLILKADNGKLLNKDAFMAPYLVLGFGWLDFKVYGDLYDQNNNPYDYSSFEPVNDGIFETRLDQLRTELPEGYSTTSFYSNIGLGLRFRFGKQLELFAQSDFKHAFTDYLDDVSGLYREGYDTPEQQYAARPGVVDFGMGSPLRGNNDGKQDWYINHRIGIKLSIGPRKSAFRASRISPYLSAPMEDISAGAGKPSVALDSLSSTDTTRAITNNYITFIQLNKPYNRDSSYYSFKILEADVSILNYENQLLNNRNLTDQLNAQLDSLQSLRQRVNLDTSNDSVKSPLLLTVEKEIERFEKQLEEALAKRKELDDGLMTARLNKELYQNAYRLSLERQNQSDSSGFVNELLELPGAVRKALTQQGAFYQIDRDTAVNSPLFSSGVLHHKTYLGEEQEQRPFNEDERAGIYAGQRDQLYAELTQERARNSYLRRELQNYADRYLQPLDQRATDDEQWLDNLERRNDSKQNIFYRINDYNTIERRNTNPGYILPVVVPNNRITPTLPEQRNLSPHLNHIPKQLDISSSLPRFNNSWVPLYIPKSPGKNDPPSGDTSGETITHPVDTVASEKKAPNLPINSKVEIYFDNDQANPREQELMKLQPLATIMKNNPAVNITISGFADNTGRLRYNLNLINERTSNVKSFLIEKFGIDSKRINILPGGLIVRENGQKPNDTDRKVEVWIQDE